MAYQTNDGFYYPYANPSMFMQPMQPQFQPVQQVQQNNPLHNQKPLNTGMIWVQGEAGARNYLMAPDTTLPLWDSDAQTIYIKSTDKTGKPDIQIIDYVIREPDTPNQNGVSFDNYAKRSELELLCQKIDSLKDQIDSLTKHDHNDNRSNSNSNNGGKHNGK